MKRACVLAACGVLAAACQPTRDGAVRVVIAIADEARADCVELNVLAEGAVLASQRMPRPAGKSSYQVAVKQGDLPGTVQFQAVAWLGACESASAKLNGRSQPVEHAFPKHGVEEVALQLGAPDAALDADRDGYVGADFGGPDCDDAAASAHPGGVQVCSSSADADCNGLVGCADPACTLDALCLRPPSKLAFNPVATSVGAGDCSGPITLETRDLTRLAPVGVPTVVTLTGGGVALEVFTTPCTGTPVASVTLPIGRATTTLYVRAASAGSATLTAQAPLLSAATATVTVDTQPVGAVVFATPPQTMVAGGCSGEVVIELRDTQGRPTLASSTLTVALSATPALNLTFHDVTDATCVTQLTGSRLLIPSMTGRASFRVRTTYVDVTPTTLIATVLAPALTGNQPLTVLAAQPSKLVFANAQQGLQVNVCSPLPVIAQLQDTYGNPAVSTAAEAVTLDAAGPGTITWFEQSGCGGASTLASSIAPGSPDARLYISGSLRGAYVLGVTWRAATGEAAV